MGKIMRNGKKYGGSASTMAKDIVYEKSDGTVSNVQDMINEQNEKISGGALLYNTETDYFGMEYNGVWQNVFFAGFQIPYIYSKGNLFTNRTGGWEGNVNCYIHASVPIGGNVKFNDENIQLQITNTSSRTCAVVKTINQVDLTNYSKATLVYEWNGTEYTKEIDVSSLEKSYILVTLDRESSSVIQMRFYVTNNINSVYADNNLNVADVRTTSTNLLSLYIKSIYLTP